MTATPTGGSEEYLDSQALDEIQAGLLETQRLEQEAQSIEEEVPIEEESDETSDFQARRDARRGDPNKAKDNPAFKVDNPEGTLLGPNAKTPAARTLYGITSAPGQGLVDTITDTFNFFTHSARKGFNIPEVPKVGAYESNVAQAIRNISGLVIPSMGFKSMLVKGATKLQAAKFGPAWLQRLGNKNHSNGFLSLVLMLVLQLLLTT